VTRITEAIFENGMLRPQESLSLRQNERVRIIIQSLDMPSGPDREQALQRLRAGIASMNFKSNGPYPTREELHERR
jgi:predicted DNA-binding antitoxin AbrB/MazE fold protein